MNAARSRQQVRERLLLDVAVRDHHRAHARLARPALRDVAARTRRRPPARCRCRRRAARRAAGRSVDHLRAAAGQRLCTCSGRDCEISQFWQHLHSRLQPAVASESACAPGRKWKNGFFSIGSTCERAGPRVHQRVVAARRGSRARRRCRARRRRPGSRAGRAPHSTQPFSAASCTSARAPGRARPPRRRPLEAATGPARQRPRARRVPASRSRRTTRRDRDERAVGSHVHHPRSAPDPPRPGRAPPRWRCHLRLAALGRERRQPTSLRRASISLPAPTASTATGSVEARKPPNGQAQRGLRPGPPWHWPTTPSTTVSRSFPRISGCSRRGRRRRGRSRRRGACSGCGRRRTSSSSPARRRRGRGP